ncbi:MAG: TIGR01777 family oxidoreductase [Kofleriaceae bacterium]
MKIVVTGATGFIGNGVVQALRERGDEISVLTRDPQRARATLGEVTAVEAELQSPGAWTASLRGCDAIVHLAGESVGDKRWDARQKQIIRDSRVESTRTIVEHIAPLPAAQRPRILVCASGVDFYPFAATHDEFDDDEVTEADPPGDSFLARVCRDWEREARVAEDHGVRVVCMRTGLVLGKGSLMERMVTQFKLFAGGRLGSGRQWFSWIHRDDVVAAYVNAVADERYTGPINLVTGSVREAELAAALGRALRRPSWLPAPGFALKLVLGEFAQHVLNGRRVVPRKLEQLGFTWKYPLLDDALAASI